MSTRVKKTPLPRAEQQGERDSWMDRLLGQWNPGDEITLSPYKDTREVVSEDAYLNEDDRVQIIQAFSDVEHEFGDPKKPDLYWCFRRVTYKASSGETLEIISETVGMGGGGPLHIRETKDGAQAIGLTERVLSGWREGETINWNQEDVVFDPETPLTDGERQKIIEELRSQELEYGREAKEVDGKEKEVPYVKRTLTWKGRLPLKITRRTGPILDAAIEIKIEPLS